MDDRQRLDITKGTASVLNQMRYGAHLASSSGKSIDQLLREACQDRFLLAFGFLKSARQLAKPPNRHHRTTLARAYYAMYHAARSVSYLHHKGDDHQEHQDLPKHLPADFSERSRWENEIKNARLERNRADYDPYPRGERAFFDPANKILGSAEEFLPLVRLYLKRKGCKV